MEEIIKTVIKSFTNSTIPAVNIEGSENKHGQSICQNCERWHQQSAAPEKLKSSL